MIQMTNCIVTDSIMKCAKSRLHIYLTTKKPWALFRHFAGAQVPKPYACYVPENSVTTLIVYLFILSE